MNETIVFVGANKRVTPLETESIREGFRPLQVCAFDYEDAYISRKLIDFLNSQEQEVLFRFIYPFYDHTFKEKVKAKKKENYDISAATFYVFEEFVKGWKKFIGENIETSVIEINSLDVMVKERDKAHQYQTLEDNLPGIIPTTIHLRKDESPESSLQSIADLLDNYEGAVYKPISGSESKGIYIVKKNKGEYFIESSIKDNRQVEKITSPIEEKLIELHNPTYVVQQFIPSASLFGGYDFDLRVHIIDGEVTVTAAYVYNQETKEEEAYDIEEIAKGNPKVYRALETAKKHSLDATKLLGLDVSGVDLILSEDYQPLITEVNCFPGWAMLKVIPKLDFAKEEVNFYKKLLR